MEETSEVEEEKNNNDTRLVQIMEGMISPLEWRNESKHYV